jgi:hypothetical protein
VYNKCHRLVLQPAQMVGRWSPTSADARRDCASHRKPDLRQCATQRCGSSAAAGRVARWRAFSSPSRSKRREQIITGELIVPPGAAAAAGARLHGRMHGGCRRCFYAAVGLRVHAGRSIHAGLRDTTTATCRMHGGCRRRHERAPRKVSAAQRRLSVTSRRAKSHSRGNLTPSAANKNTPFDLSQSTTPRHLSCSTQRLSGQLSYWP